MLHIIILGKNYFPEKLSSAVKANDKVVIIATPDGSIPVSAYRDEALKNMEVKFLPQLKDAGTQESKNALRIAQAVLIGQLTASAPEFDIYTDDFALLKALLPFLRKKPSGRKKAKDKEPQPKVEAVKEAAPVKKEVKAEAVSDKKVTKKPATEKKEKVKAEKAPSKTTAKEMEEDKKPAKISKADVKTKPAKLPTQAEVKRVLGAANSSYAKPIMEVIKKSNQITFEMDLRMKLVEAGMEAPKCQELARTINDEFGKMLPASM